MKFACLFCLVLFFSFLGRAACRDHTEENFSAEFEILNISTPQISCLFDEKGGVLTKPVELDQPGCVLRLAVKRVIKGKTPDQPEWEKNKFSVYGSGSLCKKKVGARITRELAYSGGECCVEEELARNSGSQMNCKMSPKVEPVGVITEKYVRCSQRDVNWKFVK